MFGFPGTRFRPLSLNVPKPLFPLAGQPMVHHPISACRNVCEIALDQSNISILAGSSFGRKGMQICILLGVGFVQ